MKVVVIIELDDPSHLGKEQEDKQRDQMLQEAGYDVIRYTEIPSIKQLQMDIRS
jgi:very-short-patch-repair endonuclease